MVKKKNMKNLAGISIVVSVLLSLTSWVAYADWDPGVKFLVEDVSDSAAFGAAVAVEGDVAVVGADGDFEHGFKSGALYLLQKSVEDQWQQVQKLSPSDAQAKDAFGSAVDIDGDYLAVTALGREQNKGAAYIFKKDANGWIESAKILADDALTGDYFGRSVDLDQGRLAVGAHSANAGVGAVYVYKKSGENWTKEEKITLPEGVFSDYFGNAISLKGNYLAVGAYGRNNDKGAVYIYKFDGQKWSLLKTLNPEDLSDFSEFGFDLEFEGEHLYVGAPRANNVGAVYVFAKNQGAADNWGQVAKIIHEDPVVDDFFGKSIDVAANRLAVAASSKNILKGAVYVFERSDNGTWIQEKKFFSPDAAVNDQFGSAVAFSDHHLLVGVKGDDDFVDDSGSLYIYPYNVAPELEFTDLAQMPGSGYLNLGYGIRDVNGDSVSVVKKEYSLDGLQWREIDVLDEPVQILSALTSGEDPVDHNLLWNFCAENTGKYSSLFVRMQINDGDLNSEVHSEEIVADLDCQGPIISGIKVEQEGGELLIAYDVSDDNGLASVSLELSFENAEWVEVSGLRGDFGSKVDLGVSKSIVWRLSQKYKDFFDETVLLRLRAKDDFNNWGNYHQSANFTLDTRGLEFIDGQFVFEQVADEAGASNEVVIDIPENVEVLQEALSVLEGQPNQGSEYVEIVSEDGKISVFVAQDTSIKSVDGELFSGSIYSPYFSDQLEDNLDKKVQKLLSSIELESEGEGDISFSRPVMVTFSLADLIEDGEDFNPSDFGVYRYNDGAYDFVSSLTLSRDLEKAAFVTSSFGTFAVLSLNEDLKAGPGSVINAYFDDIKGHWAENYIIQLYKQGVVNGRSESIFAPNENVTRAELLKLALLAFGFEAEVSEKDNFTDLAPEEHWASELILFAKTQGMVDGYEDGTFRPDNSINRAEALKMLIEVAGIDLNDNLPSAEFSDIDSTAWYGPYLNYAVDTALVSGYADGSFGPEKYLSRAEACKIVAELADTL